MRGLALEYATRRNAGAVRDRSPMQVAACVVRDAAGRVLLSRRRPDQMSGGYWEIPGGKVEPGEGTAAAAARELLEETGLQTGELRPVLRYRYRFPTRCLDLHFYEATAWSGAPVGREGQRLEWVSPDAPIVGPILGSNLRILRLLGLPRRVSCVEPPAGDPMAWAREVAERARAEGAGAVLLQARNVAPTQQISLARRLGAEVARRHIGLWLDATPGIAGRTLASLSVSRPRERIHGADNFVSAVLTDKPAAAADADLCIVPFGPGDTTLPVGSSPNVYALIESGLAEHALRAGAFGVCVRDAGRRPT